MELIITYLVIIACILALALPAALRHTRHRHRRKFNLPPGPKPWPVIGNLQLMGPLTHQSLHALAKKHGPLVYLRFGSRPTVVGSSAAAARFFFKTHDLSFSDRPNLVVGKYTAYNSSDMVFSPYGPYWRLVRRLSLTELFSAKRLHSFSSIRVDEVHAVVRCIFDASPSVVLKEFLFTFTFNVISRMAFGRQYVAKDFEKGIQEIVIFFGVFNLGDYIPWLGFLDLQGYVRRMKRVSRKLDGLYEQILVDHEERRLREGDAFVAKDMVDVLLLMVDDPTMDDDTRFDRDRVKAIIQNMIIGGTDSSSLTIEWAISELVRNPEKQRKAAEELEQVVGRGRWVEEDDIPRLPYLVAVVKETMRLHPAVPLLVPRQAREHAVAGKDCGGYDVPSGTQVLLNVWAMGRDPAVWEAPEEFRPERFLGSEVDVKGQDMELVPFGAGRRMCPGYGLGLRMIQLLMANLVHGFEWLPPAGMRPEEVSMEEAPGANLRRAVPLEAIVELKLPRHLY
uniref:Flavonoid 3'-hydroxylase 1 n=1 Tax=Curcuma alismatifolia TaxID=251764 RepID=A0A7T3U9K4_9LILI|nr:flavonoid 3'-hydroxylase 1 [Curcuma alismatifolia]